MTTKTLILRESLKSSIIRDTYTLVVLAILMFMSYIGDSTFWTMVSVGLLVVVILSKLKTMDPTIKLENKAEILAYINKLPEDTIATVFE